MVFPDDDARPDARPAGLPDLVALCQSLNREAARYVVIGGMAVIQAGFVRATEDIDLLVDTSPDNVARIRRALIGLPDAAIRDMADDDLDRYVVVRVADEFVIDQAACGIRYEEASTMVHRVDIEGVPIPFATPELLWRTKQTVRDKDRLDRAFLASLLGQDPTR